MFLVARANEKPSILIITGILLIILFAVDSSYDIILCCNV